MNINNVPGFPEPFPEQLQAKNIIVIHPGSQNLRIGIASSLNPHTMLHAIARRLKPGGPLYMDSFLPPEVLRNPIAAGELEEARLQVSHTLQSCLQSDGRRRYATPPQQIAAFNRRSKPLIVGGNSGDWTRTHGDIVIGDEVLHINPQEEFNIHYPMKRGDLHVHSGPGGSLSAVLANLEAIWCYAIQAKLGIRLEDIGNYRAVLVIPDIYNRQYLKELATLLMCKIGFGSCFLLQDHVAATFGAGIGYACVVDVGDQKISVSCVEDGVSHACTRVRMEYGGGDVTQTFLWLLKKCAFPYATYNPNNRLDALLLQQLKETLCHVDLNICGAQEKTFVVKHPKYAAQKYTLQVGDECIIAPLGLFTPELLGVTGPKLIYGQKGYAGDPEDPHDGSYLRETSRRGAKESLEATLAGDGLGNSSQLLGQLDIGVNLEEDIVVDALDTGINTVSLGGAGMVGGGKEPPDNCFVSDHLIGLDQAVVQSIERCPSDDLKRKMFSNILVVGGGMKFTGIELWLKNRISLQTPFKYRGEQLDIITSAKDMDPQITAWKGAAIMASLESVNELWIKSREWQDQGVKVLRERAPFMW